MTTPRYIAGFHELWGQAKTSPDYDKKAWVDFQDLFYVVMNRFYELCDAELGRWLCTLPLGEYLFLEGDEWGGGCYIEEVLITVRRMRVRMSCHGNTAYVQWGVAECGAPVPTMINEAAYRGDCESKPVRRQLQEIRSKDTIRRRIHSAPDGHCVWVSGTREGLSAGTVLLELSWPAASTKLMPENSVQYLLPRDYAGKLHRYLGEVLYDHTGGENE